MNNIEYPSSGEYRMTNNAKIRTISYVAGVDELMAQIETLTDEFKIQGDAELFAAYLRRQCRENNWTVENLADYLDCPLTYVRLVIEARIPAKTIDHHFLEIVADTFQEDHAMIFSLVSQTFYSKDNREDTINAKQQLSEYILNEINNVLFATIDERFSEHNNNNARYDQVIGELQRIIARQRRDLRFIEGLLDNLENPNLSEVLKRDLANITDQPDQETIIHFRKNLEKIVKHFGGIYSA